MNFKKNLHFLFWSLLLSGLGAPELPANSRPMLHTISITGMKFVPDNLEIAKGDSVVWKNEDIVPHTVTDKGIFDSAALLPEKSFKFRFKKNGVYFYGCSFHPTMKAQILVK